VCDPHPLERFRADLAKDSITDGGDDPKTERHSSKNYDASGLVLQPHLVNLTIPYECPKAGKNSSIHVEKRTPKLTVNRISRGIAI
jgi:hypothetical protein